MQKNITIETFVAVKCICPKCGKELYADSESEVLASLGGHMSASHNGEAKK